MCLFLHLTPNESVNLPRFKRVVKGASGFSVRMHTSSDTPVLLLSEEPSCACSVMASGPSSASSEVQLVPGAVRALLAILEAVRAEEALPVAFYPQWGDAPPHQKVVLAYEQFIALVNENRLDSRIEYTVKPQARESTEESGA